MSVLDLDAPSLVKAMDDPWTPTDANVAPAFSERFLDVLRLGHDPLTSTHAQPAPQATAYVRWTGATYVLEATDGILSVARLDVGKVRIVLAFNMATSMSWLAAARPIVTGLSNPTDTYESVDVGSNDRTQSMTVIQIILNHGPNDWTPVDSSFLVDVFGDRLD